MEKFIEAIGLKPEWVQPKLSQRKFELRAGEEVFATLEFQSAWGSLAVANCSEGIWSFKRVGFFVPRVTVRRANENVDQAIYRPSWMGIEGELTFANGRVFRWKAGNFWATQFVFSTAEGHPILRFRPGVEHGHLSDFFKYQARLEMEPDAGEWVELPVLAIDGAPAG